MGTYRKEWDCCGSVTETQSWEPDQCPFCAPAQSIADTAGAIPKGWRLVPFDPTDEMIDAGCDIEPVTRWGSNGEILRLRYREMVLAAPSVDDAVPYSAPFTEDVPQCCGDPETCDDPCFPTAQSIADTAEELAALQERFNLVAAINASYVDEIRALRESIADTAGAKLVPVEPTWEMIAKGSLLALGRNMNEATVRRVWAGMLSVAPSATPPAPSVADAAGASEWEDRFYAAALDYRTAIKPGEAIRAYQKLEAIAKESGND